MTITSRRRTHVKFCEFESLDAAYAAAHPDVSAGAYALLSVSDTGVGMSTEVKGRLFETLSAARP